LIEIEEDTGWHKICYYSCFMHNKIYSGGLKVMKKIMIAATMIGLLAAQVMAQGYGNRGQGMGRKGERGYVRGRGSGYGGGFNGGMNAFVADLPYEELSEAEMDGLLQMIEEEKLARDVYLTLYQEWGRLIFQNIAQSEQRHMDAVKTLLDKYDLIDPVVDDTVGVFSDTNIQSLYFELVQKGRISVVQGLYVGALIEDLDIFDLKEFLQAADNVDIKTVYENLMKGSRNHLRAFVSQLNSAGETYEGTYLSQEEIEVIVDSPMERGLYGQDGNPFYSSIGW
jgi:hypothetical protein